MPNFYLAFMVNAYLWLTIDSENYIFGKFDTFVKRISKIADMISTMEAFSGLKDARIEGLEALVFQYNSLVDEAKKKSYDVLDHRKQEVRHLCDVWCRYVMKM